MKNLFRYFIAFAFIGVGFILVLDNIGVVGSSFQEIWQFTYPILFIALGIIFIVSFLKKCGEGWIFGSFFIIFGTLLLLGKLGTIQFTFSDILKLWPLLIIYIGFSIIGKSGKRNKSGVHIYKQHHGYDDRYKSWYRLSIGNHEYKEPNWKVEPMDLWNAAGDFYFDFTKAFIPEEEIPITINSWAGDVQILLPENLECRIEASVKAGEINILGQTVDGLNRELFYETPGYEIATRKLNIMVILKAGSVRVTKV